MISDRMTLEQIDSALAEWQARLSLAGANLLELDDSAAYQRLRGGAAKFTGRTLAQVGPALGLIDGLWQSQSQLTEIVGRAEALRPALGRLWAHDGERRQIEFLLLGESVPIAPADTPFAERGLLSGPEAAHGLTPDTLLAQMTRSYDVVKDAVVLLEAVWGRLDQMLTPADRDADALQMQADMLGVGVQADLDAVRRDLSALRGLVETDPLGVGTDAASRITARLGRIRAQLDAKRKQRDELSAGLRRAGVLLSEIEALALSSQALDAECWERIAGFAGDSPVPPMELRDWLARVEAARQNKQWKPASVGLERWRESAHAARTEYIARCASAQALLDRREELRGLLSALQAKAGAQAARGAKQDPALPGLARDAEQLLHGRPTPLDRAAALVADYERRLAGVS